MPEYNAGDAKLRIVPDVRGFKKDLQTKLQAIKVGFDVKVGVQLEKAKTDMARFRTQEQGRNVDQKVNLAGLAQAKADIERWRTEQSNKAVNQRVNPQFSKADTEMAAWRAEQRAKGVSVPVNADTNQARTAISGLGRDVKSLGDAISKALGATFDIGKTMGLTALVANVPAAVTGVVALAQAIGQLSGAALVVPGAIATAGASIGTLAVGLTGVVDAYKAVTAAADESTTGQAERARAAASATTSLRNAVVDEALAQKDVANARRDARQELQDLNLELRGGQISEAQAINDLAKARRDLARGGFKDQLEYNDALLRVESGEQRVNETHQRNIEVGDKKRDADAKGIEGSDRVVAANERVVRSEQAVASAQQSLADATGISAAAADKAHDALAKLSPQAAEFANTLVDLRPKWQDLQKTVSGNLFEGASVSFTQFVDKVLPGLKTGMGAIATAWNSNIKTLLASLGSSNSTGLLDRILGNTAKAQSNFDKAIDPLVRGIGTLTAAGSDAVPRLATAIGSVAERFASFIEAADKDGRLSGWIDSGLEGFTNLGNILLNLGKSFFSINDALGGLGGQGILSKFRDLTEKWATFLASTEGQNKLKAFFAEGRAEIAQLKPVVSNLIDILPSIWRGAKDAMDVFMPVLREFTDLLKSHPELVRDVTQAFVAWQTIKGVTDLTTSLKNISTLLRVTIPADAASGAAKASTSMSGLSKILLPLAILAYGPDVQDWINQNIPGASAINKLPTLDNILLDISRIAQGDKPTGPLKGAVTTAQDQAQAKLDAAKANADAVGAPTRGDLGDLLGSPAPAPVYGPPSVPPSDQSLRSAIDQFIRENNLDPAVALTPDMHEKLKTYLHDKGIPGFEAGGSAKAGLAVLHDNEFVLSDRASKYPMSFKHALNEGRVDPRAIPHFKVGGPYTLGPAPTDPIAPAPPGGGIPSIFDKVISGIQGPIARSGLFGGSPGWAGAPAAGGPSVPGGPPTTGGAGPFSPGGILGGSSAPIRPGLPVPGAAEPAPPPPVASTPPPSTTTTSTTDATTTTPTAVDPNVHGASGGAAPGPVVPMSDPSVVPTDAVPATPATDLLHQWLPWLPQDGQSIDGNAIMANLPDKIQPFNIAKQFGSILLGGVLGFFGLQDSILSPSNPWNQDIQNTAGFFAGRFGLGSAGAGGAGASTATTTGSTAGDGTGTGSVTGLLNSASQASNFGGASTTYSPDFLKSKGIAPLYTRSTDAQGHNVANIPTWATQLGAAFNLTPTSHVDASSLHGGAGSSPDAGWAFDYSGKPEDEQRFADFIKTNLSGQTLQLIWQNPNTGAQDGIAGGQILGRNEYYTTAGGSYADHTDHVHWATDVAPNLVDPVTGKSFLAQGSDALKAYAAGAGQASGSGVVAAGGLKSKAYQSYIAAGMPPDEWAAFDQLIAHESAWQPTNKNPGSTAYGLGQFLDTTWATVGGAKTDDPMQQLQYVFTYLKQRSDYHGSPAAAWSLWQSRSPHWYDQGGLLPPGLTLAMNKTGEAERVLNPAQNKHYEAMLPHFALGGPFSTAVPPPRVPLPRIPDARPKIAPPVPRPAPRPLAPPAPAVPPAPAPGAPAPPGAPPGPQQEAPAAQTPPPRGGPEPIAAAPGDVNASINHNLPAIDTAIESTASTLGSIAQTAASIGSFGAAAAAGGAGAAGGGLGGGGGGGGGGPSIAGLFAQGGKIVKNIANVASSFMVGNVTPGTTQNAYGETNQPQQMEPQTAALDGGRQYFFNGIDSRNVVDELRLKDRQDQQAVLARW